MKNYSTRTIFTAAFSLLVLVGVFFAPTQARAGFFDDFIDAINPVNQIENILDGKPPIDINIPFLPMPVGFALPTIPDFLDIFEKPPFVPVVKTDAADNIGPETVRLRAYVNPNLAPDTVVYFQWGTLAEGLVRETGRLVVAVPSEASITLTGSDGLIPGNSYMFRAVAENSLFTEEGDVFYFNLPALGVAANPTLAATCAASPASPVTGNPVTWTATPTGGSGSYTYAWSGTDGLSGTNATTQITYGTTGTKNASVVVTSGSETITASCSAAVAVNPNPSPLDGSCVANPSTVGLGGNVTWNASVQGGTGSYMFSWSGTDGLSSTNQSVSRAYYNAGTVNATVNIISGAQTISRNCSATITSTPTTGGPGGGGGGGAGGGMDQPSVAVGSKSVPAGSLASASFVYLSQVPYTGIEDHIAAISFMAVLAVFAAVFAGMAVVKKHG